MRKSIITLAILVMAIGNVSLAQRKADIKSNEKELVFRHYGLRNDDIRPAEAIVETTYDESYRYTYTYDEYEFYLIETLIEQDLGDGWNPFEMITCEYDFSGSLLESIEADWDDGDWKEWLKTSYTYSDNGMEIVYQVFDGTTWNNEVKEVYNYNGDMTTVLFWEWNGSTWSSSDLHTYTYGITSIEVLKQYMQGGAWQNEEKVTYTLDFLGNVTEIFYETWWESAWMNDGRTTYNYENEVYTSMLIEVWEGNAWHEIYRYGFVYEDGNATRGECMHLEDGEWKVDDGDIEMAYCYNAANDVYYGCEVNVIYIDVTCVGEKAQTAGFKVCPVPAESEILIEAPGFQKAEIYSVTGQKLMESRQSQMNVGTLAPGVYLLKVYDQKGKSESQRIVVK